MMMMSSMGWGEGKADRERDKTMPRNGNGRKSSHHIRATYGSYATLLYYILKDYYIIYTPFHG
jgi:hypothetical protein